MDLGSILHELSISLNIPVLSALALGLLTAISPCPMATNIVAIAYVSRRTIDRKYAVITGVLYTLGRIFSYSILGILIIVVGLEIPWISSLLQDIGDKALGPLLIIVGLLMLIIHRLPLGQGDGKLSSLGGKVADWGMIGGFLLGALFALAFCPYSAILFFGVLIPMALKSTSGVVLPAVYAIGTGLPVLIFGTLLALGVSRVSTWLNAVTRVEKIFRIVVAVVFIAVGIYYVMP